MRHSPGAELTLLVVLAASACGQPAPPRTPSNTTASEPGAPVARPATIERDCFLGADRCVIELDLDGDGRADRVDAVRQTPCEPVAPELVESSDDDTDDPPCRQGLWITLATGATAQVGAGVALAAPTSTDESLEPLELDDDLGFLRLLAISHREDATHVRWNHTTGPAACDGDGLVLSGSDAAAVLCFTAGRAAAYHLGF
jgi:hypothetical protein